VPCCRTPFVIRDPLHPHYKLHSPICTRPFTRSRFLRDGAVATARNFGGWTAKKWGRYARFSLLFCDFFHSWMPSSISFSDSYLFMGEELRSPKAQWSNSYPFTGSVRILAASPRHTPSFCCLLPFRGLERPPRFPWQRSGSSQTTSVHYPRPNCASRRVQPLCSQQFGLGPWVTLTVTGMVTCVFHAPVTFRARKASKPFPRISIRKRLHQAYGRYQRELPLFTKRPSREEILTENLCDLPSRLWGRRPLSIQTYNSERSTLPIRRAAEANRTRVRCRIYRKSRERSIRTSQKLIALLDG